MTGLPRAVVLLSGGLDSTTLLYLMKDQSYEPIALSVHYGQRHSTELAHAQWLADKVGATHSVVDIGDVRNILGASSLTSEQSVPEGHYAAANMAQTVVPNRNAILLALAFGYAITVKAGKVCTAVHAGDHAIYPDCRPEFIKAFEGMEQVAITREIYGVSAPSLYAPFLNLSKAEIVKIGDSLGVPWKETWSCYQGDLASGHCGRCGTCVERIEAFRLAGVIDPTHYQDPEFATSVLQQAVPTSRR